MKIRDINMNKYVKNHRHIVELVLQLFMPMILLHDEQIFHFSFFSIYRLMLSIFFLFLISALHFFSSSLFSSYCKVNEWMLVKRAGREIFLFNFLAFQYFFLPFILFKHNFYENVLVSALVLITGRCRRV